MPPSRCILLEMGSVFICSHFRNRTANCAIDDKWPGSHNSRCACGTILLATLIAVVAQTLTLSNTESRVVDQIRTKALTEAVKDRAVRFIQSYWRFVVRVKKESSGQDSKKPVRLATVVEGDIDGDGIVDKRERKAREQLIYSLHQWRVMKRKGKESQLTTLSKDVSTVLDDVSHLKSWSATTHDRVTELKENTLDEIKAMSKKLDAILKKVG